LRIPTDALAGANGTNHSLRRPTLNQLVRKVLVIPLAMVVRGELLECWPEMSFTERNDAVEAVLSHD
jgi:hypothetical protein